MTQHTGADKVRSSGLVGEAGRGDNQRVESTGIEIFPLAPIMRARLMAAALLGLGGVLLVATVVVFSTGLPLDVLSVLVLLVLAGVLFIGFWLLPRWYVLRLDPVGYRVRFVRGAGRKSARWTDVTQVDTATIAGGRCLVLGLRDGATTTIPVDLVQGDSDQLVRDLRRRLDTGHGYRRKR